eukprot:m.447466 g.447466  ORF g.447466 m.447466 type:complete len:1040 (+) comp19521_c0_seq1:73-3192(+)
MPRTALMTGTLLGLSTVRVASSSRVVDRYFAEWVHPPTANVPHTFPMAPEPPGGPYAGNGDVNVMLSGNASSVNARVPSLGWVQRLSFSKNDMWGSDATDYYPHLSAGKLTISVAPPGASASVNGSVAMFPGNATLVSMLTDQGGKATFSTTTRVLENNAVVTALVCTAQSGGACPVTLVLSDTNGNVYKVPQETGAAADGTSMWWRKENLHNALNPAYIGSCDAHVPLQSTERAFAVDATTGAIHMANGSCLWMDETASPSAVTSGACTAPQGAWTWKGNATNGDIVHTASSKCLSSSLSLGACGSTPFTQISANSSDPSLVYLKTGASGCIVVVPDNNNNTLGVAVGVADASGNLVKGTATPVSPTDPSAGTKMSLSLTSGMEYTLLVGFQTLRDIGCAGIRPQWETCTTSPQAAATALITTMAGTTAREEAVQASSAFWSDFWAASSVDLTSGNINATAPAPTAIVERWYYLTQYLLGCTTRDGKVTSALDGFVCVEPVAWDDQFTLDYNLEATFWGAGSSNRLSFIHPVMASTTNPGAVATAQLRAQNPGTWGYNARWAGQVGHTVAGAACHPNCPNLTTTGFKGAEWPSAGMPLGDNRLADSDLQTRFIGGLLATNLIQYWEYSRNMTTLRDQIYPFVKLNAEFYLSYAVKGADGKLVFPYTCAQEGCACRDAAFVKVPTVPVPNSTTTCKDPKSPMLDRCPGANGWMLHHPCYECFPDIATGSPDGNHNAHPDVAFASSSFRNAVRFAKLLGVDSDMATTWQAALDSMPDYPSADFTFVKGAVGEEFNGGAGFLVEAEYGYQPGVLPNGSTTTPVTWPWCNKEYPISNFAAMWPTDEIGATQTEDAALLARAKQTVYALNNYQAKPWANTNGFCLSWPPAVRVSGQEDAETLVSSFAKGILSTTGNNGCVHNHGGMLENIGATVAINDLLLQSHGGRMRFFPAWNATALGAASFTTLRAYGAFLVSASVDSHGTVSPVTLSSDVGEDVVFESPWPAAPKVVDAKGASVPTTKASNNVYSFPTDVNGRYTISSS